MKLVKLSDLFRVGSSKRVLKSDWKDAGVPFYRGREITRLSKTGFADNELFVSEEHFKDLSVKYGVPVPGDIMVTAIGTIGNTYIVNERDRFYFKDASVLWLHKEAEVDSRFIDYWLKSDLFFDQLDRGNGATVDTLTIEKLSNVKLLLPSLDKQRKVVEKLDAAFADIDLLEGNLGMGDEKANQLLQSLLSSAFSSTTGQNDFTKLFKVIPDSKSKIKSSSYLESGKYAVVDQGKELVAGYTDTSPTVDEKSLPVVVFGDHTRAVKYVDFPFTAGADGTQILKPSALTNPKYGFYLVLHAVGQIPSKGYARHFGELKKMQFQLPSLGEQRKIVEKLDRAFAEIEILKARVKIKKDYATALRKSLLNSAFTLDEAVV
jgi:type I restriction enzyme S subunit